MSLLDGLTAWYTPEQIMRGGHTTLIDAPAFFGTMPKRARIAIVSTCGPEPSTRIEWLVTVGDNVFRCEEATWNRWLTPDERATYIRL